MQINTGVFAAAVVLVASTALACGPSDQAKRSAESAVAANRAQAVSQAGEVVNARREAQTYLDSARASFVAKDRVATGKNLRDAASFTRHQSDSATGVAKEALAKAADELQQLAARVDRGGVTSVRTLDYAFARTHLAEAQHHCTRAIAAWQLKDRASTGAELMMLVDHYERAAADAGQPLSESARTVFANAQTVSSKLAEGFAVDSSEVDSTLAAIDKEVHTLMATAARLKG